jgi:hypothetical protein
MCQHRLLPTADCSAACEQSFAGRPSQVRDARALIAQFVEGCPGAGDTILLISELCANAITHSASGQPGGTFTVRIQRCGTTCICAEVEDQSSGWDGNVGIAEPPHGLFLLRELSSACGTRRGEEGWITWFTIAGPAGSAQPPQP